MKGAAPSRLDGVGPAGLILGAFALVAAFVVVWFPARERSAAREALQHKADNQAALIAYTIGPAIDFGDLDMVDEVFRGAARDGDFVGVLVTGDDGVAIRSAGAVDEPSGHVVAEAAVDAAGRRIGTLRLLMSEDRIAAQSREQLLVASSIAVTILLLGGLVAAWVVRSIRRVAGLLEENARALASVERAEIRSRFLALMSHEIRTPLNGVLGLADVLTKRPLDERSLALASSIVRSGRNLLALINDVLDVAKLESGRLEVEQEPFDPERSAMNVVETLLSNARSRGVELVIDVSLEVPAEIQGDRHRFEQVLTNLVGNALKFTERGSVVLTLTHHEPDQLGVAVRDSGVGIPAGKLESIFEAFSQADASTTRRFGGTGLGLTISRDLVRLMGGTLRVESVEGQGSTFSFTVAGKVLRSAPSNAGAHAEAVALIVCADDELAAVLSRRALDSDLPSERVTDAQLGERLDLAGDRPALVVRDVALGAPSPALAQTLRRAAAAGRARIVVHASVLDASELEGVPSVVLPKPFSRAVFARVVLGSTKEVRQSTRAPRPVHLLEDGRLLVAEDDPTNRLVIRLFLEQLGVLAELVENGRLALERVESGERFDLVLLDGEMPEMDGGEAARRIRAWEARTGAARVPIIGVSAHSAEEQHRAALDAGMDGYLTKPLTLDAFVGALQKHAPGLLRDGPAPTLLEAPPVSSEADLVDVFERSTAEVLLLLQAAAESSDWAACATHAHRLKGSCLVLGAAEGAEAAAEVERCAKAADDVGLMSAVVALEIQLADAAHVMRASQGGAVGSAPHA